MATARWIISLINTAFSTWVFVWMWNWYIAPEFGVRRIGFVLSMGISCLVAPFTMDIIAALTPIEKSETADKDAVIRGGAKFIGYAICLLIGWAFHFAL